MLSWTIQNTYKTTVADLTSYMFGLFPVRSPLLGESHFDFFSSGYLDVSLPLLILYRLLVSSVYTRASLW